MARSLNRLDGDKIEALVEILRDFHPVSAELHKIVNNEADYFKRNTERTRYPTFRVQGLFVGSGVVEAGCRTVIAGRLKRPGCFGRSAVLTPSSPSVVLTSTIASKITGNPAHAQLKFPGLCRSPERAHGKPVRNNATFAQFGP